MNRFVAGDRAASSPEGTKMLTSVDPPLSGLWSCSSTLFKYGTSRCRQCSARLPSALSCATAGGYAAWPSVLMTRGAGWFAPSSALTLKALGRDRVLLSSRGENPGSLRLSPPPGRGNATCLHPDVRQSPGASCHSSV